MAELEDRNVRNRVRQAAIKRLIEEHPGDWERIRAEEWERHRPGKPPTSDPAKANLPVEEMARAYVEGASLVTLASRYGVGKETVRQYLLPTGVLREKVSKAELPDEEIRRLYVGGASLNALAEQYGVDRMTIRSRIPSEVIRGRGRRP